MNCKESEYLVNEYADGSIDTSEKETVEKHLSECTGCKDVLAQTKLLLEKLSSLPKEIVPEAKERIWERIDIASRTDLHYSSNGHAKMDLSNLSDSSARKRRRRYVISGTAAVFLLGLTVFLIYGKVIDKMWSNSEISVTKSTYWKINKTGGTPALRNENSGSVRNISDADSFTTGEWIMTDNSSSARIRAGGIGSIKVEPGTKIKFVGTAAEEHRLLLESGTIEAFINAKPRTFFVETKSATAIDLGCSYTLTVSENGDGILYVKEGLVALEAHGRESLVPAGRFCIMKEGIGPGTPYGAGSSPELKNALMKFDFHKGGDKSISIILRNAKNTDAVTLLNMLQRVDEDNKAKVYERLTRFVPPPKEYPPDSVPLFNPAELEQWIDKMQNEIGENIRNEMKNLHKQLDEMKMNMNPRLNPPGTGFEFNGEKLGKEFKFKWKNRQHKDNDNDGYDTLTFNNEEFQKELELNVEEIKKEMERVKEELEDIDIRIKIEMKGLKDSIRKEIKKEIIEEKNDAEQK